MDFWSSSLTACRVRGKPTCFWHLQTMERATTWRHYKNSVAALLFEVSWPVLWLFQTSMEKLVNNKTNQAQSKPNPRIYKNHWRKLHFFFTLVNNITVGRPLSPYSPLNQKTIELSDKTLVISVAGITITGGSKCTLSGLKNREICSCRVFWFWVVKSMPIRMSLRRLSFFVKVWS